jgi:hypothetical protein
VKRCVGRHRDVVNHDQRITLPSVLMMKLCLASRVVGEPRRTIERILVRYLVVRPVTRPAFEVRRLVCPKE